MSGHHGVLPFLFVRFIDGKYYVVCSILCESIKVMTSNLPSNVTVGVKSHSDALLKDFLTLSSTLFFDYFSIKYLASKYDERLCSVLQWLTWKADQRDLGVPEARMNECLNSGKRFIFQPCDLSSRVGGSHANAVLIDNYKKTVERFEPHGSRSYNIFTDFKYDDLDGILDTYFKDRGYTYIRPSYFCPATGPQSFETAATDGLCASWSLYYIDMRMNFPDMEREELVNRIVTKIGELKKAGALTKYMQRYTSQVYFLMLGEFPEYREYFVNFKKYDNQSRPPAGFSQFKRTLETLVRDTQFTAKKIKAPTVKPVVRHSDRINYPLRQFMVMEAPEDILHTKTRKPRKPSGKKKAPAKKKTASKKKAPAKKKTTSKKKAPAKKKTTSKKKTPVKRKTPVKKRKTSDRKH
jgi:hypothetical protein